MFYKKNFLILAIICCKEFLKNENDPNNNCFKQCYNAFFNFSKAWTIKLYKLKKCTNKSVNGVSNIIFF